MIFVKNSGSYVWARKNLDSKFEPRKVRYTKQSGEIMDEIIYLMHRKTENP